MFSGGLQRVARLTVDEYESQRKKNEEKQAIRDQKKVCTDHLKNSVIAYSAWQKCKCFESCNVQIDDDLNLEREKRYLAALPEGTTKMPSDLYKDPNASLTPGWDEDDEDLLIETEEEKLKKRTKEILQTVIITVFLFCLFTHFLYTCRVTTSLFSVTFLIFISA